MKLNTLNVNNTFGGTIVIPIPNWLGSCLDWFGYPNHKRAPGHIIISWGKSNDYAKIWG